MKTNKPIAPGPLAELVGYMHDRKQAVEAAATQQGAVLPIGQYPELPAIDDFLKTWTRLRTRGQLQASLAQVPDNAGPLNSSSLVHRSLTLMREVSPGYLQHFLSYVDTVSWMVQMDAHDPVMGKRAEVPKAGRGKKAARSK